MCALLSVLRSALCCVVLCSRAGMEEAIRAKHNIELDGRKISVKEAIPQVTHADSMHVHVLSMVACCPVFSCMLPSTSVKEAIPQVTHCSLLCYLVLSGDS